MQIEQITKNKLEREYKIILGSDYIKEQEDKKVAEVAPNIQIPGFRQGKVPYSIIQKKFGASLLSDIIKESVEESIKKLVDEYQENPITTPDIKAENDNQFDENLKKQEKEFSFNVKFEVEPEIEIIDISNCEIEKPVLKISDDIINEQLEKIAESIRKTEAKDGKAEKGDLVKIKVINSSGDVVIEEDRIEVDDKDNEELNEIFNKAAKQSIGKIAGDEFEVSLPPLENPDAEEEKIEIKYKIEILEVLQKLDKQEISEEIAQGEFGISLEELKNNISQGVENEYKSNADMVVKKRLFDYLDKNSSFDVPKSFYDQEYEEIKKQFEAENDKNTHEQQIQDIALRRVKLGLYLAHIAGEQGINATQDELRQEIQKRAANFANNPEAAAQIFQMFAQNKELLQAVRNQIIENKATEYLIEKVSLTNKELTKEEFETYLEDFDKNEGIFDSDDENSADDDSKSKEKASQSAA